MIEWLQKAARTVIAREDGALEFHIGEAVMTFEPQAVARLIERAQGGAMSIVYTDDLQRLVAAAFRVCAAHNVNRISARGLIEIDMLEELNHALGRMKVNNPP